MPNRVALPAVPPAHKRAPHETHQHGYQPPRPNDVQLETHRLARELTLSVVARAKREREKAKLYAPRGPVSPFTGARHREAAAGE